MTSNAFSQMQSSCRRQSHMVLIMLLVSMLPSARCTKPPTTATSKPAAPAAASQPTTAPVTTKPAKKKEAPMQNSSSLVEFPADAWLGIERLYDDVEGGWINGHSPKPNRIVIETHKVARFSMDVSHFKLDWSKRVWVRINNYSFQLTHKRSPVIHMCETSPGAWKLVEPHKR